MLHAAGTSDFAEYVDPRTGEPRGTRSFGWTAALTLDLLAARATASAPLPAQRATDPAPHASRTQERNPA
ncbi:hypothetical protein [Streptomyces albidoflavus]|uniref:hypothetical protein n=1 Tax=Streptomyces TaxID=1883 RepID=UPI00352DCE49